jgi:hypothetical protein
MNLTIRDYLDETKYICEHLIELINKIECDMAQINHKKAMIPLYRKNEKMYQQFSKMVWADGCEEEFSDYLARSLEHAQTAATYQAQIDEVEKLYNNALFMKNGPLQSVSQALLHIAKQGISLVYGKRKSDCENAFRNAGKALPQKYNVGLLDIIWEGRNQSIHYEDGHFMPPVETVFNALLSNHDSKCQALRGYNQGQNKAYEIIKILDWTDYSNFHHDMLSLSIE